MYCTDRLNSYTTYLRLHQQWAIDSSLAVYYLNAATIWAHLSPSEQLVVARVRWIHPRYTPLSCIGRVDIEDRKEKSNVLWRELWNDRNRRICYRSIGMFDTPDFTSLAQRFCVSYLLVGIISHDMTIGDIGYTMRGTKAHLQPGSTASLVSSLNP